MQIETQLTEAQKAVFEPIKTQGKADYNELKTITEFPRPSIRRICAELRTKGLIKKVDRFWVHVTKGKT